MNSRFMSGILTGIVACLIMISPGAASRALAKEKLRIAITSYGFLFVPVFVAKEMGYFDAEGLDVEIINTGSSPKAYAALAGGNVEFLVASPVAGFRARAAGLDSLIVGAVTSQYASNIVVSGEWAKARKLTAESPYADRLAALKGITIGTVDRGGGVDQLIHFLAKEAKLNPQTDMEIPVIGAGEAMLAAFSRGRIQGFGHSSPVSDTAVRQMNGFMLFNMSRGDVKPLDGFLYISTMVRESWAKNHEDATVHFLRAIQRALASIHDPARTTKARDAVKKAYHANIDPEFYAKLWDDTANAFPRSIGLDMPMIKRVVSFVNEFDAEPLNQRAVDAAWTDRYAKQIEAAR
jgi:NitT/TauT family transport system substrate-binding protein